MTRSAVTYEQVEGIANSLYATGNRDPSARSVREELAKRAGPGAPIGSPNTIQRHINSWREKARPVDPPLQTPHLPQHLVADIARALSAAALAGREQSEKRLVQVQAELEELAASGEGHEAAIDDLTRAVLERTSERDTISGRLKEQSTEIERLTAALAHQSRASETLRLEIAKLMVQTDGVEARAAEVLEQLATLRAESMTCTNELKIEKEARSAVERRAEVSESRLQNSQEALTNANDRLAPLHARVQEGEDFARRAVAAEATVSELRGLVGLLQTLLSSGRSPVSPACPSWDEESGRDPVDAALSGGASA